MLKAVLAATTALVIAGSTVAYAQKDGRTDGSRRWQPTADDIRAFQAARLAALRAGLALSPDQERHWPPFETAMRELQQLRLARVTANREARRDGQPDATDPAARMRDRATRLSQSGAALQKLAAAMDPLYRSLDDAQKRRFAMLSRMGGPRGMRGREWRGGGEPGLKRGQRRTDVTPEDGGQQFGGKLIGIPPASDITGSPIGFSGKVTIAPAPAVQPGFGGKVVAPDSI